MNIKYGYFIIITSMLNGNIFEGKLTWALVKGISESERRTLNSIDLRHDRNSKKLINWGCWRRHASNLSTEYYEQDCTLCIYQSLCSSHTIYYSVQYNTPCMVWKRGVWRFNLTDRRYFIVLNTPYNLSLYVM